ncbi:MAG: acetyltransferase [Chitinophagales bacterium]|nr:acetyltransferase [Chitinophagales bacterium]
MKKLVIFGSGDIAQIANYYFEIDSEYEVVAFTVNKEFANETEFENKLLIPFEELSEHFNINDIEIFIALSYASMNTVRERIFNDVKAQGYKIASYISSKCSYMSQFKPGENAFIFEDNTIQPFVKIADNVTLWSGNHIGHHSTIDSHNFISSQVVISGHCHIKSNCFLGVNSTLAHKVTLEKGTLLGAGTIMSKDSEENGVYVAARSVKIDKSSFDIKL